MSIIKNLNFRYFLVISVLMLFTLVFAAVIALSLGRLSAALNFILIVICASLSGFISVKIIEKITHKEKKEILAGSLIPLPATIGIMLYITVVSNLKFVETIDPVLASMIFFVCFNIPFLVMLYEHEKHKHHLVGFIIIPMILAVVYLFAYFITFYIAAEQIKPQLADSLTMSYDAAPVKSYVESCMKTVAEDAVRSNADIKSYLDSNLEACIQSFDAFDFLVIRYGQFSSSVIYGEKTITIKLYYPVSFTEGSINFRISDFQTTIER